MTSPHNPFQSRGPATTPGAGSSTTGTGAPTSGAGHTFDQPLTVANPPTAVLAVAGALAAVGLVVAAIGWSSWFAIIGWALAGPLAIGVLGAFMKLDIDRRAEPVYVRPDWIGIAYAVVVVLVVAGVLVGAISVACWAGRA